MADKTSLSCGEALDISHATALHGRMQKALQKSSVVELKAHTVQKADTAGLQLVLSLKNEIETTGGQLIWKKPSNELIDAAKLLGLYESLGLTQ